MSSSAAKDRWRTVERRAAAAVAVVLMLAACGGGGGSKAPPLAILPVGPEREDVSGPREDGGPQATGSSRAAGIVARTDALFVSTVHGEGLGDEFFVEPVCTIEEVSCSLAGQEGKDSIRIADVAGLAEASLADGGSRTAGVDAVSGRVRGDSFFGGWLDHAGFGVRTQRLTEDGLPFDFRYGLAAGQLTRLEFEGSRALAPMTWRGLMVGVRSAGAFWNSLVHGDAELRFVPGRAAIEAHMESGDLIGTVWARFSNVAHWLDGTPFRDLFFDGVPVRLEDLEVGTQESGVPPDPMNPGAEENFVSTVSTRIVFGGGAVGNRMHGGLFGPMNVPAEVAGVFEQGGLAGAFGAARVLGASGAVPFWATGPDAEEATIAALLEAAFVEPPLAAGIVGMNGAVEAADVSCGAFACRIGSAGETVTVPLGVGGDARGVSSVGGMSVAQEPGSGANAAYESWGAWGRYSAFQTTVGVKDGTGLEDSFAFALPVSHGYASGTNPVSGAAVWEGLMLGVAHDGAAIGEAVSGNFRLTADLEDDSLDVNLTGIAARAGDRTWDDIVWEDVAMAAGTFRSEGIEGRFYGPNHEEVGGIFERSGLTGSFGGSRSSRTE